MFANQKFVETNYVRASEAIAEINFEKRSSPIQFFRFFFFNLKAVSARRGKT